MSHFKGYDIEDNGLDGVAEPVNERVAGSLRSAADKAFSFVVVVVAVVARAPEASSRGARCEEGGAESLGGCP